MTSDPITRLNTALEGRYRIEREIGEGGMATVYLAEDLRHERKVALKVLKPELAAVVGAERFLAEIKTTANLQHPHILPLFDSGQAESFLYYVMPYVEGDTLRDKIDREKQLSIEEALKITEKVASALDYAHQQGVVHRDIKPGNILLSSTGEPTVADFGIALAVAQAGGGRVTETGLSVGTPHYMSPEQATGDRDVDPRTDVYALGCVLYEMLTGEPPYSGASAQAVLARILTDPAPAPTKVRLSIPPNVDAAIRKALEKLPADRFTTAQEFAGALGDSGFRHGEEAAADSMARGGLWNPVSVTGYVLALVLALALGWTLLRPEPSQRVTRQVLSTEGWDGLDAQVGRYAAIAPDGSSMILPLDGQLALKMQGSTEITTIAGTEGARDVVYSPDGRWIAYAVGTDLFKRPIVGGSPVRLAEDAEGATLGLAWADDGTILYEQFSRASGSDRRIVRIPEDGGEAVPIFWPDEQVAPVWVHGLPAGRGALVVACLTSAVCGADRAALYVVDLRGLSWELAIEQVIRAWYAPTGNLVYVRADGSVFAAPFDLGDLEITGSAARLFDRVRVTGGWADMRLEPDGTLLYVEGPSGPTAGLQRLVVIELNGGEQVLPLAPQAIPNLGVGWSPDGESVTFVTDEQIYTYNVALNTAARQITFEGRNSYPVFAPNGTQLAFSSQRDGTAGADLFVKDLNDDAPPRSIIGLEGGEFAMQWPSDTLLLFERGPVGSRDLWMVDLSDPEGPEAHPYLDSQQDLRNISISPDGTLAAYRSDESGQNEIYVRSFPDPGEPTRISEGGGAVPFWSPDGVMLYYFAGSGRPLVEVRLQRDPVPAVLSRDTLFSVVAVEPLPGSALHPEGDRFVFASSVAGATPADDASQPRLILVQNFFEELRQVVPD